MRVKIEPGTLDRLRGEIADKLKAAGWTVKYGPQTDGLRFAKGATTIGASVWEDIGTASVGGSGGCVK